MHIVDIIAKKRDGLILTEQEIKFIVQAYTKGEIPDYQISALLMAIYFSKMNESESTSLALAMRDSGDVFDLSDIKGIKVDKHSTGGVGDKVTLVLAPLLAYHGATFAKMSGRGLGHTGGTIDKLEAIPGYKTVLSADEFKNQVNDIGVAVVGQSGDIAPADKKIYALRDVTATVESIPLIAASIMSKKLASGADVICLDVKVGSGAFMKNIEDAVELATLMVKIGKLAGKKMTALLTNMDEPLGHKIGNGLEVYEAIETLKGNGPADLADVTCEIGAYLLLDSGIEKDFNTAKEKLLNTLNSGKALDKLRQLITAQGGDERVIDNPNILYAGTKIYELKSLEAGFIETIDALAIGKAAMRLGAGRESKEEVISLAVGLDIHTKIGDKVQKGQTIITVYHQDKNLLEVIEILKNSIKIGAQKKSVVLIEKTIR